MNLRSALSLSFGIILILCSAQAKSEIELDMTFGNNNGYVKSNISAIEDSNDFATSIMRLSNGELLVAGLLNEKLVVLKYDSNGSLVKYITLKYVDLSTARYANS